ncbi:MAG: hypothetical protein V4629_10045 [Pseudomonadota bacterium]
MFEINIASAERREAQLQEMKNEIKENKKESDKQREELRQEFAGLIATH